jgi:hypothetical protein
MTAHSELGGIRDPNERTFPAPPKTKYLSTRLVVHSGVSVAIALRVENETGRLAFDYVVLDPSRSDEDGDAGDDSSSKPRDQPKPPTAKKELLDSQGWSEPQLSLSFPKEVRLVGEEAVPNLRLPCVDKSEQKAAVGTLETQLHPWFSSTLCLTDNVPNFEALSDGELQKSRLQTDGNFADI